MENAAKTVAGVGKNRLEALTDGIFAFALTVLVLAIDVPPSAPSPPIPGAVESVLAGLLPNFVHYVLAFLMLASFWVTHHHFFSRVRTVDRSLIWLSIAGLLFVALVPFSTDLAGTFDQYPLAAIFFEVNIFVIGVIFFLQWRYASLKQFLEDNSTPAEVEGEKRRLLIMPMVSVAAVALAVAGVTGSADLYFLTPLAYGWAGRK